MGLELEILLSGISDRMHNTNEAIYWRVILEQIWLVTNQGEQILAVFIAFQFQNCNVAWNLENNY